ncbi:MAG: copper chaperone, partial [Bacteroidetes bacterium]|nr:copper chaperone [Bacteroidota bacterium]
MKSIIIFIFSALLSSAALAQSDIKTDSFKVDGNCNMCKNRIEEAAYVRGVK